MGKLDLALMSACLGFFLGVAAATTLAIRTADNVRITSERRELAYAGIVHTCANPKPQDVERCRALGF